MLQLKATLLRKRVVIEAVLLYLAIASVTTGLVGYSILFLSHTIQYMMAQTFWYHKIAFHWISKMFLISRLSTQVTFTEREKYWSAPFLAFFVITTFIYAVFAIVTVNMVSLDCMNGKERSQYAQHHISSSSTSPACLHPPTLSTYSMPLTSIRLRSRFLCDYNGRIAIAQIIWFQIMIANKKWLYFVFHYMIFGH